MANKPQPSLYLTPECDRCAVFTRTVDQRRAWFIRVAQRISLSRQDAEDIVQESVLRAFEHLSSFRGESRMETWLYTIVVNTARTWLRSRGSRVFIPLESDGPWDRDVPALDLPHPGKSPEESCSDRQLHRLLLAEIQSLDPMYRLPIRACDLEERSYCEAAAALSIKSSTLKARLFHGRAMLKRRLRHDDRGRRGVR
ncbi:MAG TPA: RNA polymerase sigma factor [Acidobacteriaceae bacterium]|jgi:RNA polymerase sigma-70 factor, ECF subfamily|nr:RNA polymerase sigma factor [Acidobacteriaceae bacterium]